MGNALSVCRVGDQVVFQKAGDPAWYTIGYYQLTEIASVFGPRLGRFGVFGRILEGPPDHGSYYRIPGESVPAFAVDGVKVGDRGLLPYLSAVPTLLVKLKRFVAQYDVAWFMLPSVAGLLGLLFAPRRGVRVAQLVGEWATPLRLKHPYLATFVVPLLERLTKLAIRRAHIAVFVSEYLREKFGKCFTNEVLVANESRLRPWMMNHLDRSTIHEPLRILYVGRLVPEKGVQFLLKAVKLLSAELPCMLWIAGEGPYAGELRRLCVSLGLEDSVSWLGWLPWGEKVFARMREADVFVLPSQPGIEGLPLVLAEAMSQSLPVVASATGGILELVKHEETGLLFPPGDHVALAHCLKRIALDTDLRLRLVEQGLEVARRNTFEATTGRVIEAICREAQRRGFLQYRASGGTDVNEGSLF